MKTIALLLTLLLSTATFADAEKRYLTNEEINDCKELASMASMIQDIRVTDKIDVWDFYYKHGDILQKYRGDKGWHLIRKVYHVVPATTHPAHVYKHLFLHCTKYTFDIKPEVEYKL